MNVWNAIKMEATKNLEGGFGTVYRSNEFKVGNVVITCMRLQPNASIGKHMHKNNEEVYVVLEGAAATINGEKRNMHICRVGEEHDCINQTFEDIIILSIKRYV